MGDRQIISTKDVPPALLAALRRLPGTRATVFLILEEDEYETKFGDGRFLYPRAAFLEESAAAARLKQLSDENAARRTENSTGTLYSMKTVEIARDEANNRMVADLRQESCEEYTLADVIRLLV